MKILVPVDLGGNFEPQVMYASEAARAADAGVYLFYSAQMPDFYVTELEDYGKYNYELKAAIKRIHGNSLSRLQEVREKYFDAGLKVVCKAILAKNVYDEIISYAENLEPDLIILGKGESGGRIRIGANTERVLRLTEVPVIVVNKISGARIRKIVFASDFRKNTERVFEKIMKNIRGERVSVRLLYVNTKSAFEEYEEIKERIERFKKNFSFDFSVVIRAGKSVEASVVRYANSIGADLIAMGIKRKKGVALYFTDRITEGVINLSDIPVLVVSVKK